MRSLTKEIDSTLCVKRRKWGNGGGGGAESAEGHETNLKCLLCEDKEINDNWKKKK